MSGLRAMVQAFSESASPVIILAGWLRPLALLVLLIGCALHWRRHKGLPCVLFEIACVLGLVVWAISRRIASLAAREAFNSPGGYEAFVEATRGVRVAGMSLAVLALVSAGVGAAVAIWGLLRGEPVESDDTPPDSSVPLADER